MSIDTLYRIMSVRPLVGYTVKTTFPNMQICMKLQLFIIYDNSNHDDPANHDDFAKFDSSDDCVHYKHDTLKISKI